MRIYYDLDADVNLIRGKRVAVIGYGSQGHAHALNLKESGVTQLAVALRSGSGSGSGSGSPATDKAEGAGLKVMTPEEAANWANLVMVLIPDEGQGDPYRESLAPNLRPGAAIAVAGGH
jgi:ketol-acid reductoisomerase